jgi:hypothetical protein
VHAVLVADPLLVAILFAKREGFCALVRMISHGHDSWIQSVLMTMNLSVFSNELNPLVDAVDFQ